MSNHTVHLHRVLRAKPEKVYRAFLDARALAKWLPPYGFTCAVHHLDARVGGTFRMSFHNERDHRSIKLGDRTQLATMWQQLFPVEQCRLAQLLIERVVIADGGLEIVWRDRGWHELAGELMPGTIGAELQELEETA